MLRTSSALNGDGIVSACSSSASISFRRSRSGCAPASSCGGRTGWRRRSGPASPCTASAGTGRTPARAPGAAPGDFSASSCEPANWPAIAHMRLPCHCSGHERLGRRHDRRDGPAESSGAPSERSRQAWITSRALGRDRTPSGRRRRSAPAGWSLNSSSVMTPKLPPPPRSAPEQIGVLVVVRDDDLAVGRHDVGREEVVAGEAVLALEPAAAAAGREAGDARRRDAPAGDGEPELLRLSDRTSPQLTPPCARAVRCSGSTRTPFRSRRSSTMPSSTLEKPATEWPPLRIANGSAARRARSDRADRRPPCPSAAG